MMNISTHNISGDHYIRLIPQFTLYGIQGFINVLLNLTIFLSIWRAKVMRRRKEYVLISALALMDALTGLAMISAGVDRTIMILSRTAEILVTGVECLFKPWIIIFFLWDHAYGALLATISIDRLLMVLCPLLYLRMNRSYAFTFLVVVLLPYTVMVGRLVYKVATLKPLVPQLCFGGWLYSERYVHFIHAQSSFCSMISVVLYVIVIIMYKRRHACIGNPLGEAGKQVEIMKQRRFTVTVGLSCVCTLCLHVIPLYAIQIATYHDTSKETMAMSVSLSAVLVNFNPMCNFALYWFRHHDMKMAVRFLFCCKDLTHNALVRQEQVKINHRIPLLAQKENICLEDTV